MCRITGSYNRREDRAPIWFGSYNTRNGRNSGLESALRGMSQENMYLGVFRETKITGGFYTHGSDGYSVVASDVPIQHRGEVSVLFQESPRFSVEAINQFGPKVVSFQMATGER